MNKIRRFSSLAFVLVLLVTASCSKHTVVVVPKSKSHVPPGQAKKVANPPPGQAKKTSNPPPGQAKKANGDQSAKKYAPGQQKNKK